MKTKRAKQVETVSKKRGGREGDYRQRQKLLAIVEFGSRPQGRLIPHRQFINNTLVLVDKDSSIY
jgi:hypothetical protein